MRYLVKRATQPSRNQIQPIWASVARIRSKHRIIGCMLPLQELGLWVPLFIDFCTYTAGSEAPFSRWQLSIK